jgi:hypothetical protein
MATPSRRCSSCGVPIVDALHEKTKKTAPIEAQPVADGNIRLDEKTRTYTVVPKAELEEARRKEILFINHFARCKDAPTWRRK